MPSRQRSPVRKMRGRCRGTGAPAAPSLLDALIEESQRTNQSEGSMAGVPVRLKITDAPTKPTELVLTVNIAELDAVWERLAQLDPQPGRRSADRSTHRGCRSCGDQGQHPEAPRPPRAASRSRIVQICWRLGLSLGEATARAPRG